jgi:hypothetical protein
MLAVRVHACAIRANLVGDRERPYSRERRRIQATPGDLALGSVIGAGRRLDERQSIAHDGELASLGRAFPVWEERVVELERDRVAPILDGVSAEFRAVAPHRLLILFGRARGLAARGELWPASAKNLYRVAALGVEGHQPLGVVTVQVRVGAVG